MQKTASTTASTTLDGVEVECTYCGIRMASHMGSGRTVRYFHCPSCQRWTTSAYKEVFKADTKMRTRAPSASRSIAFDAVKDRLELWLRSLEQQDPYRELGVSPRASEHAIRERYRELARLHHPDRGGSVEAMSRINAAYERILRHQEQRHVQALMSAKAAEAA
jgi:hypothetical protein